MTVVSRLKGENGRASCVGFFGPPDFFLVAMASHSPAVRTVRRTRNAAASIERPIGHRDGSWAVPVCSTAQSDNVAMAPHAAQSCPKA